MALLSLDNLAMYYALESEWVKAVDGISLSLDRGETVGIVGESGCGKTSLILSILRLLPENARFVGGRIVFDGMDLLKLPEQQMRRLRWRRISMIFQNAMNALNPVFRVGDQVAEALMAHEELSKREAETKVSSLFELVGLPGSRMNNYPHEFSGGMKQRAIIAMSLVCNPDLIIADEPTTALDVVVQDQVLRQIKEMQQERDFAMIVVSHDMSVIAETCEKVAVMYSGRVIEQGNSVSLFHDPRHPYTMGLLSSFPTLRGEKKRLSSIEGSPPDLSSLPEGCLFQPRCPYAKTICEKRPAMMDLGGQHFSECHFADDPQLRKTKLWGR